MASLNISTRWGWGTSFQDTGILEREGPELLPKSAPLFTNGETKAQPGEELPQVTMQIPLGYFIVCLFVLINLFTYLFLAALGLHCRAQAFCSCGEQGLLFVVVRGLLIAVASLVAEHGL